MGTSLAQALDNGLWEVSSRLHDGKIANVIFTIENGSMVLLHGFIKEVAEDPKHDLDLLQKRKAGCRNGLSFDSWLYEEASTKMSAHPRSIA